MKENQNRMITFKNQNGEDVSFIFLDIVLYKCKEYFVLISPEDGENEVVILQLDDEDPNEEAYVSVHDDKTLEAVFQLFKKQNEDNFIFIE